MFLNSKEMAYTGILMAISVILVTLGGYFDGSTLFFLAAASFLTGVIIRKFSIKTGILFLIGSTILSFIFAPQKLYCATFLAFGIYVVVAEEIEKSKNQNKAMANNLLAWFTKGMVYHVLLLVSILLIKNFLGFDFLFSKGVLAAIKDKTILFIFLLIMGAESIWLIFDRAYLYFQRRYGTILCGKF